MGNNIKSTNTRQVSKPNRICINYIDLITLNLGHYRNSRRLVLKPKGE